MATNQGEKGRQTIKAYYKEALTPQTFSDTINFPDGRREVKTKTYINQNFIDSIEKIARKYNVAPHKTEKPGGNSRLQKALQGWLKKLFGN